MGTRHFLEQTDLGCGGPSGNRLEVSREREQGFYENWPVSLLYPFGGKTEIRKMGNEKCHLSFE